jgi:hypothetical protein
MRCRLALDDLRRAADPDRWVATSMRLITSGLAATAALVAIAGPGCGSSSTSCSDEVRQSMDAYRQATERRDGDGACEQLSRSLQRQVLRAAGLPRQPAPDAEGRWAGDVRPCAHPSAEGAHRHGGTSAVRGRVSSRQWQPGHGRHSASHRGRHRQEPLDRVRENDHSRLNAFGTPHSLRRTPCAHRSGRGHAAHPQSPVISPARRQGPHLTTPSHR